MVQSYICYVTKPIVEVELSKFRDLSSILSANVWGLWRKGNKGEVKILTVKKKDGNSDPEAVSDWSPVSSHKASGDLEKKTPSLKVMKNQSGLSTTNLLFSFVDHKF